MNNMGYVKFKEIDCIFYEENDSIRLMPTKENDNLIKYIDEKDFIFTYNRNVHKCRALIKRVEMCYDKYSIRLVPQYTFECIHEFPLIHGFTIVGDAFDDFFSPVNYFLMKHKNGEVIENVVYGKENVECWKIRFENKNITVSLSYGEILNKGRRSDLMLHPKLSVSFEKNTDDLDFVYRVYNLLIKFIQVVRYDLDIGWYSMALIDERGYECGRFYDIDNIYTQHCLTHQMELNYITYKPFIGRLLQFIADHQSISLSHLPQSAIRNSMSDYDAMTFISLFGAFEEECKAKKDLYLKVDISNIKNIRKSLMTEVQKFKNAAKTDSERNYIEKVISRISTTDTSVGLKNRILNGYNVLLPAIESSVPNIFNLFDDQKKETFRIEKIADKLSDLRGTVAHGDFCRKFTNEECQNISFLEILTYSQLLKRARLLDGEIELIIGIIFNCNIKYIPY